MKYSFFFMLFLLAAQLPAKEVKEVCEKCQRIREYNKEHPGGEYEFYEDYLKAQDEKSQEAKGSKAKE